MSNPVTNVEIEDVLSSIRRLVSDGERTQDPKEGAESSTDVAADLSDESETSWFAPSDDSPSDAEVSGEASEKTDRFVLTPALMVVDDADKTDDGAEAALAGDDASDTTQDDTETSFDHHAEADTAAYAEHADQAHEDQAHDDGEETANTTPFILSAEALEEAARASGDTADAPTDNAQISGDAADEMQDSGDHQADHGDHGQYEADQEDNGQDDTDQNDTGHDDSDHHEIASADDSPFELTNMILDQGEDASAFTEHDTAAQPDEAAPEPAATDRASLVATIAELEAAVSAGQQDFEPDGSEVMGQTITWPGTRPDGASFAAPEDTGAGGVSPDQDAPQGLGVSSAKPSDAADSEADAPVADIPFAHRDPIVDQPAPSSSAAAADPYEDDYGDDLDGLLEAGAAGLDEEALRTLIAEVVRDELTGTLGERITRNVRKLVRREIYRILSSQEFD